MLVLASFVQPTASAQDVPSPPSAVRQLAVPLSRLERIDGAIGRAADGAVTHVLGVPAGEVARVFAPISPDWALPLNWAPPDLVPMVVVPQVLGQPASAIVLPDLEAMVGEARSGGAPLVVLSAFRSSDQQAAIFERNVERQFGRADGPISREEAESRAARFTARPGHSQHQLGTAIDFTTPEIGYGIGGRFGVTDAGEWLIEHSWRFGFVFPYTEASQARSGYQPEPWHVRWVGRALAAAMQADGYLNRSYPITDDYVLTARQLATQLGVVVE